MFPQMKKRKYKQKARAVKADETRSRIVAATVKLHEEFGPAQTSIKSIAEEAGVQRLTVYRHFPDDESLFQACTSHWLASHPLPGMPVIEHGIEPSDLVASTLLDFYRYYRANERMWTVSYRDVDEVEALQAPMAEVEAYLDQVRKRLLAVLSPASMSNKQLSVTLGHCLRFTTWQSLKSEKLSDKKIVELVMNWIE